MLLEISHHFYGSLLCPVLKRQFCRKREGISAIFVDLCNSKNYRGSNFDFGKKLTQVHCNMRPRKDCSKIAKKHLMEAVFWQFETIWPFLGHRWVLMPLFLKSGPQDTWPCVLSAQPSALEQDISFCACYCCRGTKESLFNSQLFFSKVIRSALLFGK